MARSVKSSRLRRRRSCPEAGEHRACSLSPRRVIQLTFLAFERRAPIPLSLHCTPHRLIYQTPSTGNRPSLKTSAQNSFARAPRIFPDGTLNHHHDHHRHISLLANMRATRVLFKHTPLIKFIGRRSVPKRTSFSRKFARIRESKTRI